MPIYEYKCTACAHVFEEMHKATEQFSGTCPSCGNDAVTKMLSQTSFRLKGTGWYVTDFKNSGKQEKKSGTDKSDVPDKANSAEKKDEKKETVKKQSSEQSVQKSPEKTTRNKSDARDSA